MKEHHPKYMCSWSLSDIFNYWEISRFYCFDLNNKIFTGFTICGIIETLVERKKYGLFRLVVGVLYAYHHCEPCFPATMKWITSSTTWSFHNNVRPYQELMTVDLVDNELTSETVSQNVSCLKETDILS